ncbi:ornithine cyclodeaminase [Yoonia sp.]|uniref:ornithine cyclodeaminase family protein n=1 Tax=Yoonia sp. TaxID=2212373 RepID=UPI002DFE5F56|nr:ornithine cyclodeaminase [Yoonia sp.]
MLPMQISYEDAIDCLSWTGAVAALRAGHQRPKAQIADMFLGPSEGTLLSRGAYIEGLGYGVKSVTVFGANPKTGVPTVQGAMLLFEPVYGQLEAVIESRLVTEIKTAADSVLGAMLLARPDSRHLLVVGAGTVARSLIAAYSAMFPQLTRISNWARRPEQAEALAQEFAGSRIPVTPVTDLAKAAAVADIISTATMAREPILRGCWIKAGTHIDLIGAYKKDMREADDALIARGALFVDSRETTIKHIGELDIPISRGVISADSVLGDLYDLTAISPPRRRGSDIITIFKNGGGAHLDLMISAYIRQAQSDHNLE